MYGGYDPYWDDYGYGYGYGGGYYDEYVYDEYVYYDYYDPYYYDYYVYYDYYYDNCYDCYSYNPPTYEIVYDYYYYNHCDHNDCDRPDRPEPPTRDRDLEVQCVISDYTVEEGDYVTVAVDIYGGDSPYDIRWYGDTNSFDDFDRDDRSQRVRIDEDRNILLEVEVRDDDGNVERDVCRTIRVDEEDRDRDINVITTTGRDLDTPDGDLAGLQSVYLNQVPYTGPVEDAWKALLFTITLLAISSIAGYAYYRKRQKLSFSDHIQNFKERNRLNRFN